VKPLNFSKKNTLKNDSAQQEALKASGAIPEHIAIIMDGNGRWAKSKGGFRLLGHKQGVESVRDITESCAQLGVRYLTLYAFSTENWERPNVEVKGLMSILVHALRVEAESLNKNNIRLTAIGQIDRFPQSCQRELQEAITLTQDNTRMTLCLALSYSGRWDITQAVKQIAEEVEQGKLSPEEVNDQLISSHLSTCEIPDPDLIIRTSGEFRISNFLLWQLAYSEFYITDTYWPDFRRNELYQAIKNFQNRERRFGKTSDQIQEASPLLNASRNVS
jgi:undecaprenyl diphosphate synthase